MKVHIIGGGNLGVSIALGIVKFSKNNEVTVTRRNIASIQYLSEYGITVSADNKHNIQEADVVILTIKPYQVDVVLAEILPVIQGKTIASAVSGLSLDALQSKTNNEYPVIRIMPNIAAQFGESATCISFPEKDREKALPIVDLFQDLGTAPVIDEKLMGSNCFRRLRNSVCIKIYSCLDAGRNRDWFRFSNCLGHCRTNRKRSGKNVIRGESASGTINRPRNNASGLYNCWFK